MRDLAYEREQGVQSLRPRAVPHRRRRAVPPKLARTGRFRLPRRSCAYPVRLAFAVIRTTSQIRVFFGYNLTGFLDNNDEGEAPLHLRHPFTPPVPAETASPSGAIQGEMVAVEDLAETPKR